MEESEPFTSPEDEALDRLDSDEPPPRRGSGGPLPWILLGVSLFALGGTALYARKVVDEAHEQVDQLSGQRKDLQAKLAQGESSRKEDRARAIELAGKNEELLARGTELESGLKDKQAQLSHLQQTHDAMVTQLQALVRAARGKGLAKKVAAILAKGSNPSPRGARHSK